MLKWEDIENFEDRKKATIILRRIDNKNRASKNTIDEVTSITFLMRRVIRRLKVQFKRNPKYCWLPCLFLSGQVNWDKVNNPKCIKPGLKVVVDHYGDQRQMFKGEVFKKLRKNWLV